MHRHRQSREELRIGLFGGTFDPIHNGHLAVARAARRRFRLDRIYFIPCGRPPHKDRPGLSPYLHRFAMVVLGCAGEPGLLPSLLEAGPGWRGLRRSYSIDTVRRLRRLYGPQARLYFLLGADAFLYLPTWKHFRQLIRLCDFIVAARPGFSWRRAARRVLPAVREARGGRSGSVHFLPAVRVALSATRIRRAARGGSRLAGTVPRAVADYIQKMNLYRRG
ncbi:MAG: nicotinate (nicotinamide) nucleotide adenylyltransferase [Acidobacteria bacterium]|nr:nicotinate (nicotinamide) nucleotide adenylyltransferase [Acidobacteriota bacterium]